MSLGTGLASNRSNVALRTALGATQEVLKQFRVLPCAATVKVLDDRRSET